MQFSAFLLVRGEKILVLVRATKTRHYLKLRLSGTDGNHLIDESIYLEENDDLLQDLKIGKTICC